MRVLTVKNEQSWKCFFLPLQSLRIMQKLSAVLKNNHHAFILTEDIWPLYPKVCNIGPWNKYLSNVHFAVLYTSEIYEPTRTISRGWVDRNDGPAWSFLGRFIFNDHPRDARFPTVFVHTYRILRIQDQIMCLEKKVGYWYIFDSLQEK